MSCLANLAFGVLFYSVLFALCVRGWTAAGGSPPSLKSFDPKQRIAAVEAVAKKFGGKP